MGDDARLRTVVALAQGMAVARGLSGVAHAAADGARTALGGSFAAVSVWERERGRLRVLVNTGELATGEEEYPADESYPVHDFPEVTGLPTSPPPGLTPGLASGVAPGPSAVAPAEPVGGTAPGGAQAAGPLRSPAGRPAGGLGTPVAEATAGPAAGVGTAGVGTAGDEASAWVATAGGTGPRSAALRARGRGSCVVAPVLLHGRAWGELYVARRPDAPPFGSGDAGFAAVLASVVAAGLVQLERLEEVRRLAFTDPLTGLANRRAADARLDEVVAGHLSTGGPVGLIVCDINGLKAVNDSLGHMAGDRLLERFGSVLSLCGAHLPGALAARLGGDEFCLVVAGQPADQVVRAAEEVCRRAAGLELGEGVACGVACTDEDIGPVDSARRLFRLADAAQYRAKSVAAREPVVAGREGPDDAVVRLADAAAEDEDDRPRVPGRPEGAGPNGERRSFRGRNRNGRPGA